MDGYGGPLYIGSGCFHRRDVLSGRKFGVKYKNEEDRESRKRLSVHELEEASKGLASCNYEKNTQWGKEVSLDWLCNIHIHVIHMCKLVLFELLCVFSLADGFEIWMS